MPFVDLRDQQVSPDAVEQIPLTVLHRAGALPYEVKGSVLRVAIVDPSDIAGIDELRMATRLSLELGVAAQDELLAELQRFGRTGEAEARAEGRLRRVRGRRRGG